MASKNIYKALFLFNRISLLTILIGVLAVGCSKTETEPLEELDFYKSLLAGSGIGSDLQRTWKIDSLVVDGKGASLSSYQLKYFKKYQRDGLYNDYDGNEGVWEMTSPTSLEIEITNSTYTKSLSYSIVELNPFQLQLEIQLGSSNYLYYFTNQ
jgi:hypothetical protein|tara:strand:+ start:303 stop:764 length:462 start_codon:yes stop_codon:yes gene_type:complete